MSDQPRLERNVSDRASGADPVATILSQDAKPRLDFLDALRGLAAAYVLIYHMVLLPQPNLAVPRWAEKFAHAGGTGVTLFFIVSAFSLYYTMPLRQRDRHPTLSFYAHRFFRIAPLFYFLIVVTLLRDYWAFEVVHSAGEVAASVLFVFNLIPTMQESFVWAGWTIGVEMVFYAVFPLIYSRVRSVWASIAFVFACLLGWVVIQLMLDYSTMPVAWKQSILQWFSFRHFPIFAMGAVAYFLFTSEGFSRACREGRGDMGAALILGGVLGFVALLQGWIPNVFGDIYYWQGIIFGLMLLGLAISPWRLFVNRFTSYLGKVSYSVYLTHTTVIYVMSPAYRWIYDRSASLSFAFLASVALTLAVVLPLSSLTYRFVELPGMRLAKRMSKAWK